MYTPDTAATAQCTTYQYTHQILLLLRTAQHMNIQSNTAAIAQWTKYQYTSNTAATPHCTTYQYTPNSPATAQCTTYQYTQQILLLLHSAQHINTHINYCY